MSYRNTEITKEPNSGPKRGTQIALRFTLSFDRDSVVFLNDFLFCCCFSSIVYLSTVSVMLHYRTKEMAN